MIKTPAGDIIIKKGKIPKWANQENIIPWGIKFRFYYPPIAPIGMFAS
jgi:hypothetical protein